MPKHVTPLQIGLHSYEAAYEDVGQGPVVVLLHGFMGSSRCWRSLLPYLSPYYRCICLDQFGFGESSRPMIRYDIAKLVAFVKAFKDKLQLPSITLVGHSLGGWVAAAYALAHPDDVNGLVLVAPAGIRDDSFCGRYNHLRPLLWETPVVDGLLWLMQPFAALAKQAKPLAQIRRIRHELNVQPAARSFLVHRMRPEDAIDTVEQEIHQLRVPTLVLAGDRDDTIPLWHCETYAAEIPAAQLAILPNADHSLPQTHASAVAEHLLPFLAALAHPISSLD